MARLFGTDGVRGVVNVDLDSELAMKVGRAAAYVLTSHSHKKAKIIIGKDTRISGDMLLCALAAGICSVGADAIDIGVIPTPAVAYLVKKYNADAGIVISASHNPVEFNGIKIFNGEGFKLADDIEDEIESFIKDRSGEIELKTHGNIGRLGIEANAEQDYAAHVAECVGGKIEGLKIAVDCAHGAAYKTAKLIFAKLGADCTFIGDEPDGKNINAGVGSTHIGELSKFVVKHKMDIGVAFDGDADRCLAVDETGAEIDGDKIMAVLAQDMKEAGKLKKDTVVITVMSNMGFVEFAKNNGMKSVRTTVGDRYVLEEMLRSGYSIGGEQSGHVILLDYATTGDGELTGAMLLKVLANSGKKASELFSKIEKFPQVLVNIRADAAQKETYKADEEIEGFIQAQQEELFDTGRILVRVSGTEPLIRVMVEGRDQEKIEKAAKAVEKKIKERI